MSRLLGGLRFGSIQNQMENTRCKRKRFTRKYLPETPYIKHIRFGSIKYIRECVETRCLLLRRAAVD